MRLRVLFVALVALHTRANKSSGPEYSPYLVLEAYVKANKLVKLNWNYICACFNCFATLYLGAELLSYMLYNIMLWLYLHYESEKELHYETRK